MSNTACIRSPFDFLILSFESDSCLQFPLRQYLKSLKEKQNISFCKFCKPTKVTTTSSQTSAPQKRFLQPENQLKSKSDARNFFFTRRNLFSSSRNWFPIKKGLARATVGQVLQFSLLHCEC